MTSTNPNAHQGYQPHSSSYRRIMISMFAAGVATFVLLYSTQALLPEFVEHFGVTPTQSTLTISLTTAALAIALLVAGPLSESVGRTRLIHFSIWASAAVTLACAFAPTWEILVGLRVLAGLTLAGLPAVATAYLREELDRSALAGAVGLYIGGNALGGMTGRLISAPIADALDWRWAMAATAAISLVCAVTVSLLLPRSRNFRATPQSPHALVTATRRVLSDPVLLALYALAACASGTLVGLFNALGFRLTAAPFAMTLGAISLIYLVYPLGSLSSALSGRLADRHDRRQIIPAGCAIGLLGVLLTCFGWLPAIVAGMALVTVGFFCMHGLASSWVTARAHAIGASTGQAASIYLFSYYVGSSVFGNLGSTMWTHRGWPGVAELTGGLLLVSAGLIAALRRTTPATPTVGIAGVVKAR